MKILFKISLVSQCGISRLGDLPIDFDSGTCGTFIMDEIPVIFLCFDWSNYKKCRNLRKQKTNLLNTVIDFEFETEFLLDEKINNSIFAHYGSAIANYQGFPLVLGDWDHSKLEMFDIIQSQWVQKSDYPFASR